MTGNGELTPEELTRLDKARERQKNFTGPPSWNDNADTLPPGAMIVGVFDKVDEWEGAGGRTMRKATLIVDDREERVHLYHTKLWSLWQHLQPVKGERVAIRFEGKRKLQGGKSGFDYTVILPDREDEDDQQEMPV